MKRSLISACLDQVDKKVKLSGWVNSLRSHGQVSFIDLRDRSGLIQVFVPQKLNNLKNESVISIVGTVKARQPKNYNPALATGKIEILADKIEVLSQASDLPFDIQKPDLSVSLPVMLDYRAASLKHPKIRHIFEVQATITQVFRQFLLDRDFTEFHAPTLVATATEGGSQVFGVDYFGYRAFLAQSPQFYKQIMVSIFERVFTVSHAYRAEPSVTTRHLTEYVGLDAEMGFIDSWKDVYLMADSLVKAIFKAVAERHTDVLAEYQVTVPKTAVVTPVVKLSEAQEIIFKRTKRDI
ncbi:aspartate--tRNA(Asn) ligase, partial [Patescibacteria group bacterium]|nr:aspartate--tRNA(Asn) ligase [Patescibacteria group bacterium]